MYVIPTCPFWVVSQSRAALSLLGYCYFHIQDFTNSADCYEQLTQLHPEVEEYKVYYAQSLYKAGAYPEAAKASFMLDNPGSHMKVQPVAHTVRIMAADLLANTASHPRVHNIEMFDLASSVCYSRPITGSCCSKEQMPTINAQPVE